MRTGKLATTEYSFESQKGMNQPENTGAIRFVFLTDFHDACTSQEAEQLFRAVRECDPDFVLCGGDMLTAWMKPEIRRTAHVLVRLSRHWPVFYALGNHEGRSRWMLGGEEEISYVLDKKKRLRLENREEFEEKLRLQRKRYRWFRHTLEAAGVRFLENEDVHLTVKGRRIRICGLDISRRFYRRIGGPVLPVSDIRKVFGTPDPREYTILLAHTPRMLQTYQQWGADLTLCGHYHGGVMRFGKHRGLISPDLRLFPGNAYGCFSSGDKHVIVSSGCGEHTIPFRICNPREVVNVRLSSDPVGAGGVSSRS